MATTRKTAAKKTAAPKKAPAKKTAPAKKAASPAKAAAAERRSDGPPCSYGDGNTGTARGLGNAVVCAKHAAALRAAGYNVNEL